MLLTLDTGAAAAQPLFSSSAVQYHALGAKAQDRTGRTFRYCQAGELMVQGKLYQAAAPIANHLALTAPAVAIGATQFTCTPGATGGAANLYAEGYLQVDTTPGEGYTYVISGHPAIVSSTAFTLTLDPQNPIQVALTTSSRIGLRHHPYKNLIIAPTTLTAQAVGFSVYPVASGEYGWVLTRGLVSALINGTPAVTAPVINSATAAGAVDVWTAAAQPTAQTVGKTAQVGVSGKYNFIYALID